MFYVEEENKEAKQGYSKEKTEFLIFHYNYWEWVDSSNFVPA